MSLRTLETAILAEARVVAQRPKMRQKDILEWCSSGEAMQPTGPGEEKYYLPRLQVWVCVKAKLMGGK